jgi:hypothetical protein
MNLNQSKMVSELTTITNTKKTFHKNTRFLFEDYLIACPFSIDYMRKKNRKQEVMQWRQIGMAWYALEFNSITQAGVFFNHDHSTVIHALKCIQDRKFNPCLSEKINEILQLMDFSVDNHTEIGMKEVNSLVHLEKLIRTKLQLVEK